MISDLEAGFAPGERHIATKPHIPIRYSRWLDR